jgi:hypothetical protein
LKSTSTPLPAPQTHSDFAPEPDLPLTPAQRWKDFWPEVVALIDPIHKDLALIGQMLTSIHDDLETANKQNAAASELNNIQLTAIRSQIQAQVLHPGLVQPTSSKRR